ncbi:TonB-dependent receptor plug domain-containing protein [Patiriisocius sp. Uisw_017]|jgi:iron complex outermembrane receptor protein|uniref:TonB-dependent receptor plug domain-containing protein n=1 Tax=Patiriisocius sp. Uisw_017 TaxID=3230968 RepID=UPI0039ED156B
MKLVLCLLFFGLSSNFVLYSQTGPVNVLGEVLLSNTRLRDSVYTNNVLVLNDSVLRINQASLTNLLNFNSTVYLKENGLGMVSSPSFRGTTASQTAVLWNGININSQTTGQTDFNTINTRGFNSIEVTPGGGSVANGSGAIGGSINLVNKLTYDTGFTNQLFLNYGEYNTYGIDYQTQYASKKTSITLGVSRNGSDNDYPYPETDQINQNGQYHNTNLSLASGYKLDKNNTIHIFANIYKGRRNFSVPTPNALQTKYTDLNTRSLVEWESIIGDVVSNLKVAMTTEEYEFFANIDNDFFTFGNVESFIANYKLEYSFSHKMLLSLGGNYTHNSGRGSDIQSESRNLAAATLSFKHEVSASFLYEIGLRQETNEDFGNPLLYSAGIRYKVSPFYQLKLNTSKNFRIPTYNDLYWSGLGDPNLKPETSYQAEMSHIFSHKKASLSITGYFNQVTDLLRYIPGTDGIFRPENTNDVHIYGLESIFSYEKKIANHSITVNATYAYTVSENKETEKQLIYVPFHKFTAAAGYRYKKVSTYYQYLNNGEVFTTTDNTTANILDSYMVANLGAEYALGNEGNYKIGVQLLNLWNEAYESVLNRPLPGRNINFYLNANL